MTHFALPALAAGEGLTNYLTAIKQFPLLKPEEELAYARRLREDGDRDAAYHLVTSHLRLVAKLAMRYRGYGLPIADVISEGNIGLMQAVKRFDPSKGFKLATYASWWIKATIQDYILRSWSIVQISATSTQKRLFFNLRRLKSKIAALEEADMQPDHVATIARRLNVSEREVIAMNRRFLGDMSLNATSREDDEEGAEWLERLPDPDSNFEEDVAERSELNWRRQVLTRALAQLTARERRIIEARWLSDTPLTLDELAAELSVSRERVRQVEVRALEKARAYAASLSSVDA
ncbi:RNA polymerase sigma factor RpoH [Tardiphaga sp. 37S4]|jgi:RNA polymerase sigma-32 factor|uniref:RNA polymerase sigma factor RpoH n=1 Tax=unclassified Tardiphaga TaxID=2631404 RepID=UPI0008A7DC3F|nr:MULTISPECIES: RNA polymerase sigma factor RpoH [unclassified Tardiphaga]UFS76355.1 RNA polymerase sigma factor RpoH [Tardiphaga sp. 37S4]SEI20634.1 RNA polymerase, sigma 32 subunit, RpoH [Tardiphaga sp. OK245]